MDPGQNAIKAVSWFCFSVEAVAIITRLGLKWQSGKSFAWDDGLCMAAAMFSLASTIATEFAAINGLGRREGPTAPDALHHLQVDIYVAEAFHALCIGTIKLSVLAFVDQVFGAALPRRLIVAAAVLVSMWTLSCLLAIFFQCTVPETWHITTRQCIDLTAFWQSFSAIDIFADTAIIAMPVFVTWHLRLTGKKKAIIIMCFVPWISTMAVAATSIFYAQGFSMIRRTDTSHIGRDLYSWHMCTAVLRMVTIMCACVPYVRQFFEAFPSGLLQVDEIRRRGLTYHDMSQGYANERSSKGAIYYLHSLNQGDAKQSSKTISPKEGRQRSPSRKARHENSPEQ